MKKYLRKKAGYLILKLEKHKKITAIALAVLVGLIYIASQILTRAQGPRYLTEAVQTGTIVSSVSASGQVAAIGGMSVTTQASGTVSQVYVKEGDTVRQGDTIAKIDLDSAGKVAEAKAYATYLSAQNTLSSDQANLNTLQSDMFKANQTFVNDRGVINPTTDQQNDPKYIEENADWLAAEAAYKNQQNVINQAQASLNSAWLSYQQVSGIIYAPTSGTITGLGIQTGSTFASASNSTSINQNYVATISSGQFPQVSVNLAEIDTPKVKVGDKVTVTFDALPNKTYTGEVQSINTQGVVTSGVTTYPATIVLDTTSSEILTNMSATADIITATKTDILLVPSAAVQSQGSQAFVRVLRNGQAIEVPVQTGLSSDTQTEITSGLSQGDEVITGIQNTANQPSSSVSPFQMRGIGPGGGGGGGRVRIGG